MAKGSGNGKGKDKDKATPETERKGAGRPSKLTEEVIEDFSAAVSLGASYVLASRYAKISEEVAALWMREARREIARREAGEKHDKTKELFLRFLRAVREAEADAGIAWQTVVNNAAKVDPQWAHKMLKTRFPTDYTEYADTNAEVQIPEDMADEYLDRIIAGENALKVVREWKQFQKEELQRQIDELKSNSASPKDKKAKAPAKK